MRLSSEFPGQDWSRLQRRSSTLVLSVLALSVTHPAVLLAGNGASASQISRDGSDSVSPPNVLTGPDFRMLMKIMHTDIVRCGVSLTAVLHWHVLPDGVIDEFVLNKSSGNFCFDQIVILNAEKVIKAKLRITPATRNGLAEAAWVPFAVAARD